MSQLTFKRITPELIRIYDDDGCVGDVYSQPDNLRAGRRCFVIHLSEDPRGPLRVFDRSRIRDEAQLRYDSHPYR